MLSISNKRNSILWNNTLPYFGAMRWLLVECAGKVVVWEVRIIHVIHRLLSAHASDVFRHLFLGYIAVRVISIYHSITVL